jgi:polar amino acid transport system substrate-binding protein
MGMRPACRHHVTLSPAGGGRTPWYFRLATVVMMVMLAAATAAWGISPAQSAGATGAPRQSSDPPRGGTIRFGADFTEPPGQVIIDGKMSGSDYELCNALAKQMGATAQWTNIDFGSLIAALNANRIDAACSSVDITPVRKEVVDFVPYRVDSEGAAVQYGNPKHVTGPDSICGLNAAELLGSIYQIAVEEQSAACTRAGKKPVDLKTFNTIADAFAQLLNGRADVVIGDAAIMASYISKAPTKTALAFQGVKPNLVGIAVRKNDVSLKQKLETALKELQANGTYAGILARWNLQSEELNR